MRTGLILTAVGVLAIAVSFGQCGQQKKFDEIVLAKGDKYDLLYVIVVTEAKGAGPQFKLLAHNEFASDTSVFNASPAIAEGRIYLRSDQALYCVGSQ